MESSPQTLPIGVADTRTDEDIARAVQKGDTEAFGQLVERYEAKLKRYGTKFLSSPDDVTDLVQDAFVRAYQNIQSFDVSLRFSPWMYRIAHNEFVSALRKRSRANVISVDFDSMISHPAYDDPAPAEREQKEMRALIEKGLEKMSPK